MKSFFWCSGSTPRSDRDRPGECVAAHTGCPATRGGVAHMLFDPSPRGTTMTHTHPTPTTTGAGAPIESGEQLLTVPGSAQTIAGITIPDTPLVRDVTTLIREAEEDLLFDHSRRVFLFGALQGLRRGLQPDLELLHVVRCFTTSGSPRPTAPRPIRWAQRKHRRRSCAGRRECPLMRTTLSAVSLQLSTVVHLSAHAAHPAPAAFVPLHRQSRAYSAFDRNPERHRTTQLALPIPRGGRPDLSLSQCSRA